jgi:hypothetical protein
MVESDEGTYLEVNMPERFLLPTLTVTAIRGGIPWRC